MIGKSTERLNAGQTNMYSASMSGASRSSRDRKGLGLMRIFPSSHVHRSCTAMMWQPQPQTKRPKRNVESSARTKKTKPELISPNSSVRIDSLGSTGAMVRPMISHWMMWAMIRRLTRISEPARQYERREVRGLVLAPRSTGSEIVAPLVRGTLLRHSATSG